MNLSDALIQQIKDLQSAIEDALQEAYDVGYQEGQDDEAEARKE